MTKRILHVDFYKNSGKWYDGGDMEIGDMIEYLDRADIAKRIENNQNILIKGAIDEFFIVTSIPNQEDNDTFFANYLYKPGEVSGYVDEGVF